MCYLIRSVVASSLVLLLPSQVLLSRETPSVAKQKPASGESREERPDATPETTPYDSNPKDRERYLRGYREGLDRAIRPQRPDEASGSSPARNGATIHGFIEGWKAGVKGSAPGAPTGALPRTGRGRAGYGAGPSVREVSR